MGALIVGVLFVVIMFLGISIHCWKMYKRSSREKRRKKERMQLDLEWEPYLLQLLSSTALFHENNLKSTWQFNRHRYWLSFRHYTMLTVWLRSIVGVLMQSELQLSLKFYSSNHFFVVLAFLLFPPFLPQFLKCLKNIWYMLMSGRHYSGKCLSWWIINYSFS